MPDSPTLTRAEAKVRTRIALLDAGVELMSRDGLDGPSLDAICAHAGYTRGAFYVHFEDRDDFLAAVMEHIGRPMLDLVLGVGGEVGLAEVSATFLGAFTDGTYPLGPGGNVKPHQLLDACARSERVRAMYRELIDESIRRIARAIEVDQKAKRVDPSVDAQSTATVLLALVVGVQVVLELGVDVDLFAGAATVAQLLGGRLG